MSAAEVSRLYGEHAGWLSGWMMGRTRDADDAADAVNDAFLSLLAPARMEAARLWGLSYWLRARAASNAIDVLRKRTHHRHRRRGGPRSGRMVSLAAARSMTDGRVGPDRLAELREEVEAALRRFPLRARAMLRMRYLEGMDYRAIGARLGVTESRVCQLLRPVLVALGEGDQRKRR